MKYRAEIRRENERFDEARRHRNRNLSKARELMRNKRASAAKKGIPFKLTEKFLVELLNAAEVRNQCPILHLPFEWNGPLRDGTPSLDRIIPKRGYVPGNIAIISWRANRIKYQASLPELRAIVAYVERHVLAQPAPKKTKVRGARVVVEGNE